MKKGVLKINAQFPRFVTYACNVQNTITAKVAMYLKQIRPPASLV